MSADTTPEAPTTSSSVTSNAEEVLKQLELPYRTVLLCSGDMGFASAQADGSVVIPDVLRPYMTGLDVIRAR